MDARNVLREEWQTLYRSCKVSPEIGAIWFSKLECAYSAENRFYHSLDHIAEMLESVHELSTGILDTSLLWATWFHDAVYNTRRSDNEERSAELAEQALTEMGISETLQDQTRRLIQLTKCHKPDPEDASACIFSDADLAILSASPNRYQRYADDIRREYHWVTENAYRDGRTKVLQRFLERPRIYFSPVWEAREHQARKNMTSEVVSLQS